MASFYKKYPIAEKNLLKIHLSNKHITLQILNNRSGNIFLQANTNERELRESLGNTSDIAAARAVAAVLAERARSAGHQQITYERKQATGGKQTYTGKVKAVVDTLRDHGIEFVQYANKRPPLKPWDASGMRIPLEEGSASSQAS